MIYSVLENAFAFDHKIPQTYYCLLFRPGFLSLEYIRGRIVRYISPTKLLWFIVIVFFALSITIDSIKTSTEKENEVLPGTEEAIQGLEKNDEETISELDNDKLFSIFIAALPYLAFISIPCFAFLMYIFFRNKRKLYVNSLIFSAHLYAALFLIMLIYHLINLILPKDLHFHVLIQLVLLLIPFIYYFVAIRVFYKSRYIGVIIKGGIVIILSLLVMITILIVFISLAYIYMEITKA